MSSDVFAITPPVVAAGGRAIVTPVLRPYTSIADVRIASDGKNFIAAWRDDRYGDFDTLAERVDENGRTIDDQPFPFVATWRFDGHPLPIWNGTEYAGFAGTGLGTFRVHISPSGEVNAGGDPLQDLGSPIDGAWNGSRFAVAFHSDDNTVKLAFFDSGLNVVKALTLNDKGDLARGVAVVSDGLDFLVVWEVLRIVNGTTTDVVLGQTFDNSGNPRLSARELVSLSFPYPTAIGVLAPAAVWNGFEYLVVWRTTTAINGAWLSRDGSQSRTLTVAADALVVPNAISIAWDGFAYLLTWGVEGVLLSATGDVTDRLTFGSAAAVASNGKSFLVIAGGRKFVVRSTGPVRVSDMGLVTSAYLPQTRPVITASASSMLAAWNEGGIYASRIDARGEPLDGTGIAIAPNAWGGPLAAASMPDVHLIAWFDGSGSTRAARVNNDGRLLDPGGALIIANASQLPLASSSGNEFLVVTGARSANPSYVQDILCTVIPRQGNDWRTETVQPQSYTTSELQSLVWTGRAYALLWRKGLGPPCMSAFCTLMYEEHLTLIDEKGRVISDLIVPVNPRGALMAATWAGDSLLVAAHRDNSFVMLRIGVDGSVSEIGSITATLRFFDPARLVRWPGGYLLLFQSTATSISTHAIVIDANGRPIEEVPVAEDTVFGDAVQAFGSDWMIYDASWIPLPEAHNGTIFRAFIKPVGMRRRAAGRH